MRMLKSPLVVYKGAYAQVDNKRTPVLVVLQLPKGAKVNTDPSNQGGNKNRASRAKVLSIESLDGLQRYEVATSSHDGRFKYKVGRVAKPDRFALSHHTCSGGIHFYLRRREAHDWVNAGAKDPQNVKVLDTGEIGRLNGIITSLNSRLNTANSRIGHILSWAKVA